MDDNVRKINLIPTIHGTDATIAMKIAKTGFAALSTLDAGWYGKGIYFTTSIKYAIPYFATKKFPAVLISYILLGNPYPIIYNKEEPENHLGKAIVNGYDSSYVVTEKKGRIPPFDEIEQISPLFDEIVIEQEGSIVPVFLVEFDGKSLMKELERFNRETPPINPDLATIGGYEIREAAAYRTGESHSESIVETPKSTRRNRKPSPTSRNISQREVRIVDIPNTDEVYELQEQ